MATTHQRQGRAHPERRLTILGRFFRDLIEWLLGRFREGPETPPRLLEEPRLFRALASETPTEEEWEAFAQRLADHAYQAGFVRGVHWLERSWDGPIIDPEKVLEIEAHAASVSDPVLLRDPMSARKVREFHDAIARAAAAGIDVHLEQPPRRR